MRNLMRTASAALLVVAIAGCGGTADDDVAVDAPTEPVDELTLHGGEFCPATLPGEPQDNCGFGTDRPATVLPGFPAFDEARLCTYEPQDVAPPDSSAMLEWVRVGEPQPLDPDQLASFSDAITQLKLIGPGEYACTADLGPRYMVSLAWQRDLTGVVIEDYGCGSVRLTDDPFVTVPGDASQAGTVSGIFEPPPDLLSDLGVGRQDQ